MYRRQNEQLVEAKSTYFTNKVEESSSQGRDLGVIFDLMLSLRVILIKSLVMLRLVCCMDSLNVVWFKTQLQRIVTQERLRDHDSISCVLMELYWLPFDKRIEYKLLLYTYKALHGLALCHLCELVVPYAPQRILRSIKSNLLMVPPGKPGKYGSRSFVKASVHLWTSLKGEERAAWLKNSLTEGSFKIHQITYLFCKWFLS